MTNVTSAFPFTQTSGLLLKLAKNYENLGTLHLIGLNMYFNGVLQCASDPHSKTCVSVISLLLHLRACGGKHYQIVMFHMIVVDWCIVANGNNGIL